MAAHGGLWLFLLRQQSQAFHEIFMTKSLGECVDSTPRCGRAGQALSWLPNEHFFRDPLRPTYAAF